MKRRLSRAKAKIRGAGIPFARAARPPAARAPGGGARRRLPDLQRGLRRPRASLAAEAIRLGAAARRADARRARGPRPARADALPRRAARRPVRAAASSCCSPTRTARCGTPGRSPPAAPRSTARSPCAAAARTCCRRRSRRCRPSRPIDWPQVAALYGELARAHRLAGGRAQPRGRGRRGGRAARRRWRSSTASRSTTTATCTRRGRSCCAASTGRRRPAPPTSARWRCAPAPERRFLERRLAGLSAAPPATPGSPAPPGP